ncbi:hypothetical protein SAMN02910447_02685 [Ruminococcus sp. YE71]|uniref:hypothetical protein n=1 Tax=unclassified Ruminococcus TaxID=2608920 RepID=UPI00088865B8|nr:MULTISPECIES: hypothetical protein [unclassified Ruminococcus]SDA26627.1 hypothetical protein SAMN02910446_02671 [Ruminococcus sp. YE78]SFW44322.1 hypothetical protein SAMN02910447_02685 [Ruminococcus sp. YE71]
MENREIWGRTRDELISSLTALGYPAELGDIIAEHIGSPRGMERMISYLDYVQPDKVELIIDEMMAIKSDIDRWREKKESERANIAYNNILNYGLGTDED